MSSPPSSALGRSSGFDIPLGYALTTKYGFVFRLMLLAEGAFRRRAARRIVVRITEPTPPQ